MKEALALWRCDESHKKNIAATYTLFLRMQGKIWNSPLFHVKRKLPFIQPEKELDALIAGTGRKTSVYLQTLKSQHTIPPNPRHNPSQRIPRAQNSRHNPALRSNRKTLFRNEPENFHVKATRDPEEIQALLEVGFEFVCQKDELMFFRKRK